MKRVYAIPLLVLLLVGLAVPLWYLTKGKGSQSQKQALEKPPPESVFQQLESSLEEQPFADEEKPGSNPREVAAKPEIVPETNEPAGKQAQPGGSHSTGEQQDRSSSKETTESLSEETSSSEERPPEEPPAGIIVDLAIVGCSGEILFKKGNIAVTGGGTVKDTLDASGIAYETSYQGRMIMSVGGQKNKGMAGWMYQVNGEPVMRSAAEQRIREGDCVIWWYSETIGQSPPQWDEL